MVSVSKTALAKRKGKKGKKKPFVINRKKYKQKYVQFRVAKFARNVHLNISDVSNNNSCDEICAIFAI